VHSSQDSANSWQIRCVKDRRSVGCVKREVQDRKFRLELSGQIVTNMLFFRLCRLFEPERLMTSLRRRSRSDTQTRSKTLGVVLASLVVFAVWSSAANQTPAHGTASLASPQTNSPGRAASSAETSVSTYSKESVEKLERDYQQTRESLETFIHVLEFCFTLLGVAFGALAASNFVDIRKAREEIAAQTNSIAKQTQLIRRIARAQTTKMARQVQLSTDKVDEAGRLFQSEVGKIRRELQALERSTEAHQNAAHSFVYRLSKSYPEALEALERAIKLRDHDAFLYWQRAYVLGDMDRYQAAVDDCGMALKCDATFVKARQLRGYYLIVLKQYAAAQQDLEIVLQASPDDANTIFNLAVAFGGLRDKTQTLILLRRLVTTEYGTALLPRVWEHKEFTFLHQDPGFREVAPSEHKEQHTKPEKGTST
jgi:tetratricopeptide (TPR) repeat protein